jgi:tripartite-type tricarboxylate transporter receptor subunit TctC
LKIEVAMHRVLIALVLFCSFGFSAQAQTYPDRPVRVIVPYAPGGITDIAARLVGAKLSEMWGQQVVVENKPGGNGVIALTTAIRAAPDGYTLVLVAGGDVALNPLLIKNLPYDVERDLVPITSVSSAPIVLAANSGSPFKSVADVVAAAKAKPDSIDVGLPGISSINHLTLEWFAVNTGTKVQIVPFKGGAPAVQALVSGVVPLAVLASSTVTPHEKSGAVCVLAVTSATRSKLDPQWPTLQEQGGADVHTSNWTALFAPKGTPEAIVTKLNADVVKVLQSPDVKERFASGGVEVIPSTPAELAARMKSELAMFRTVITKSGMHQE